MTWVWWSRCGLSNCSRLLCQGQDAWTIDKSFEGSSIVCYLDLTRCVALSARLCCWFALYYSVCSDLRGLQRYMLWVICVLAVTRCAVPHVCEIACITSHNWRSPLSAVWILVSFAKSEGVCSPVSWILYNFFVHTLVNFVCRRCLSYADESTYLEEGRSLL